MKCNDFFMLIRHVTLWRWPLTRWPWKCRVVIVCSKFHWNRTTPADVFTIWPVDLELLWYFRRCVQTLYKIRAKSHNPRQSYWPFSTSPSSSSRGWGTFSGRFSGVRGPTKRGKDTGRTWPSYEFVSELRYLAAFSNVGASNLSDVENDAKFRTFWPLPLPVKIRGGVGELCWQIVGASPIRPSLRYTFDGRTLPVCWMLCHGKKERKKAGSTAIKLKGDMEGFFGC